MSFVIKSLCIYSLEGECRTIEFKTHGINIITGRAKTGKSSIIDIIDYCFGRGECYVADGVIRESVSWFGVLLHKDHEQLFVARRNPLRGKSRHPDVFIRRGKILFPPDYAELQSVIQVDELQNLVTRFAGIVENEHRPLTGTRRPLSANISHALFFCFQRQDEIASRERLFHRQGDPFIPLAIKDTLPYFLGAVEQEHFLRQLEYDIAQKELRDLEARRDSLINSTERSLSKTLQFVLDGKRVGLIDERFATSDAEIALQELQRVARTETISDPELFDRSTVIFELQDELQTLRERLVDTLNDIRATRHFFSEQSAYTREANEQRTRLASLELFVGKAESDHICPLCEADIGTPMPSVDQLRSSLDRLDRQLESVVTNSPHLQESLNQLNQKRRSIEEMIVDTQKALDRAFIDDAKAKSLRDQAISRSKVIGRIGAFVEQTTLSDEAEDIEHRLFRIRKKVVAIAEHISNDDIAERIQSIMNLISEMMTNYAEELELEHTSGRIRLDINKLTVIADTIAGPVQLNRMGSGENWVGYHVITLLALHQWFRQTNRPVPGFLVFDQPTQAHYPPEADQEGSVDGLLDADRRAVRSLFKLMAKGANKIGKSFQLIVLDHAHLDDDWFEEAIVEEWRGDSALVPSTWAKSS